MDRRFSIDRRQQQIEVAVERRKSIERRSGQDRRKNQTEFEVDKRGQY